MLGKQWGILTSHGEKLKKWLLCPKISRCHAFVDWSWLSFSYLRVPDSTSWRPKENSLLVFPQEILLSQKTTAQPLSCPKEMFSQTIVWKYWQEIPNNWSRRGKNNWKSNNCQLSKKREPWFGPSNNLALPEILKFSWLTTVHASNHWSTDKNDSVYEPVSVGDLLIRLQKIPTSPSYLCKVQSRETCSCKWLSYSFPVSWPRVF